MEPLYLDYAATTPVRPEVRAAMAPLLAESFGNPSSIHRWGRAAEEALESARCEVALSIGASPSEIWFVRGGTESDNMAVLGWCLGRRDAPEPPRVAISAIEHHAVLEAAEGAEGAGLARLYRLDVSPDGALDLAPARAGSGALLFSVMWVNNETGMRLPVEEVVELAPEVGAVVHTDAAQAIGKVPVDVGQIGVDLLSATGHKIYGPKGTGILFAREGTRLAPLLHGGGQEGGLRPGTEDVAGAVGLATALRLAVAEQESESQRLEALRGRLEEGLLDRVGCVRVNAGGAERAPHVLSIGIEGVEDGDALLMALDLEGLAVSGGSACLSGAGKASHVMAALYGADDPRATVRFSVGRETRADDIDRAVAVTAEVVARLRGPS